MNYLHKYTTFDNVQELNLHVKLHTNKRYYDMNDTQCNVLQVIAQYSVKYAGASHLKVATIAKAVGKSERTIHRAINRLIELNVIQRLNTTRRISGGTGANIYCILPYVAGEVSERIDADKSTQAKDSTPIVRNETDNLLSYLSNTSDTREQTIDTEQVIHKSITNNTPPAIVDLFRPFAYGSDLYKYVGILFKAKYRKHVKIRIESHIDDYRACIYDVMRRYKSGKVSNLDGYLYASLRSLSRRLFVTQAITEPI